MERPRADRLAPVSFRIIYADPPWAFAKRKAGRIKDVRDHYEVASVAQMLTWGPQFQHLAGDGPCVLLMWATKSNLAAAMDVMAAWGFPFSTVFLTWVKAKKDGGFVKGPGTYLGGNAEFLLLGQRRGFPAVLPARYLVAPDVLAAPREKHSAKPTQVYEVIERCFGILPKVEVFARQRRLGWATIGLEVGGEAHRIDGVRMVEPLPSLDQWPPVT